jgi:hypothetical protein
MPVITESFWIKVRFKDNAWVCRFRRYSGSCTYSAENALRRCMDKVYLTPADYSIEGWQHSADDNGFDYKITAEVKPKKKK